MADDPTPDPQPPTPGADLGDAGKRAIQAERDARKKAEQSAADLAAELQAIKDKDKSDSEKLAERLAAAERRAADAETQAARMEVAAEKGLTAAQARRLVGSTREELEADADDLLATFQPAGQEDPPGERPTPTPRPTPTVRGGGDPTQEPDPTPSDIREIVSKIPRS